MKNSIILLLLISTITFGQNQRKVDSLHNLINNSPDKKVVSDAYYDICLRYYRKRDSIKKYAFKGLTYAQNNNLVEQEANAQNMLGIYYMRIRDLDNAENAQLESVELFRKLEDTVNSFIGRTYGNLGTIYKVKSEPNKAISYLLFSAEMIKLKNDEDGLELIKTYGRIGNLYDELGQYKKAENSFRKCEELLNKGKYNLLFHFNVNISVGLALMHQGKYDEAEQYYLKCIKLSEDCGCNSLKAEVYENFGILRRGKGNFDESLQYFIQSDSIYNLEKDVESQHRINNEIGLLYFNKENYKASEKYFKESLNIAKKIDFKTGIIDTQTNLVEVYIKDSLYKKAINLNGKIIIESKNIENVLFQIRALNSSGKIFENHLHDYNSAIESYKKALIIANKHNNASDIAISNLNIGNAYLKMEDYKNAEHYCYVSYLKSKTSKNAVIKRNSCECLYSTFERKNDSKNSLIWLKKFNNIKDSIETIKKEKAFKEIETKYAVNQKEKEIADLEGQKTTLQGKLNYLLPTIGALSLVIFLLYLFYKKSRNKVENLEEERLKTDKKIDELKKVVVKNHIVLKDKTKVYISNLVYIKSDDHYLNVFLSDGNNHFVRGTLNSVTKELPPNFIRCHRSYIVNSNFIKQVNNTTITLIDSTKIPLSRTYKDNF